MTRIYLLLHILAMSPEYCSGHGLHKRTVNRFHAHKWLNERLGVSNHCMHWLCNAIHFRHYYQCVNCMICQKIPAKENHTQGQ